MRLQKTFNITIAQLEALGLPVATTNNNKVVLTPKEYEKAVVSTIFLEALEWGAYVGMKRKLPLLMEVVILKLPL